MKARIESGTFDAPSLAISHSWGGNFFHFSSILISLQGYSMELCYHGEIRYTREGKRVGTCIPVFVLFHGGHMTILGLNSRHQGPRH